MKKFSLIPAIFTTFYLINAGETNALLTRTVYAQDVQSGVELKISSGYGLTINFIPSGEIIKQVWIGDPSRIAFSSNGNLCQKTDSRQANRAECTGGATVLFLRHIKPINFPNLVSSVDGRTQMTVITSSASGDKQYQFMLTPTRGIPSYTSLIIMPDSEKPKPLIISAVTPEVETQQPTFSNNVLKPITRTKPITRSKKKDADIIALGLAIAVGKHEIQVYSPHWYKSQNVIRLLRKGRNRSDAMKLSGIESYFFNKLMKLGGGN